MFFGQGQLKTAGRRDADHGTKSPPRAGWWLASPSGLARVAIGIDVQECVPNVSHVTTPNQNTSTRPSKTRRHRRHRPSFPGLPIDFLGTVHTCSLSLAVSGKFGNSLNTQVFMRGSYSPPVRSGRSSTEVEPPALAPGTGHQLPPHFHS